MVITVGVPSFNVFTWYFYKHQWGEGSYIIFGLKNAQKNEREVIYFSPPFSLFPPSFLCPLLLSKLSVETRGEQE